jgi:cell division protein FtsW
MSLISRISAELRGDRVIWMIVAVLSLFSLLAIYSSTGTLAHKMRGGNTEFYLLKQFTILAGGLGLMYLCYLLHYTQYSKIAPYLLVISVPLLLYTLTLGADINSAKRWIMIPIVHITFQSSDFAKLALIIYVARAISAKQDYIKDFGSAFIPIIVPIIVICGLIAPADLSTAVMLFGTCVTMMILGRVDVKFVLLLLLLGVVTFALLIVIGRFAPEMVRVDTWVARITDFLGNADGGYQVQQSKIAIAKGGWFGSGPGNSTQRNFLPSPYSDFIFATICEEYGSFGAFIVISMYILLYMRCARLVTISPKTFGAMLAIGFGFSIVFQAFINMAVSVHLIPVAGITLPLVSMGGTSSIFTCISFGIILSVSKYIEKVNQG